MRIHAGPHFACGARNCRSRLLLRQLELGAGAHVELHELGGGVDARQWLLGVLAQPAAHALGPPPSRRWRGAAPLRPLDEGGAASADEEEDRAHHRGELRHLRKDDCAEHKRGGRVDQPAHGADAGANALQPRREEQLVGHSEQPDAHRGADSAHAQAAPHGGLSGQQQQGGREQGLRRRERVGDGGGVKPAASLDPSHRHAHRATKGGAHEHDERHDRTRHRIVGGGSLGVRSRRAKEEGGTRHQHDADEADGHEGEVELRHPLLQQQVAHKRCPDGLGHEDGDGVAHRHVRAAKGDGAEGDDSGQASSE
eukprot:scaffold86229_cov72-Phaeocystis_antarctica.AAC.1